MRFKPLLATDLAGKMGGIVASHNTYGPYLRSLVKPVNQKTQAQQSQRRAVSAVSQSWRTLGTPDQAAWAAAQVTKTSRKGEKVTLSGQAAYMSVNTMRSRAGATILISPPSTPGAATLTPPTITFASATTVTITFTADPWNASGGAVVISAALLTSSGKSFASASRAVATLTNPGTAPITVTLPFAVPIGARVRLEFHASEPGGRVSTYESVDATNPSFAPPTPLLPTITSIETIGTKRFRINFSRAVSVTGTGLEDVVIAGDTTGLADGSQLGSRHYLLATYGSADGSGLTWSMTTSTTAVDEPMAVPETGTTL